MPDFGRVSQIDASAFDPATAYVAVKKPLLDDFAPYIFRTHDFGKTWTKIVNGIRAERLRARRPRGSDAQGPALRRHAARRLHLVRRRRPLAVALARTCPTRRSRTSGSRRTISRSRRTAAASTSSTTSRRCASTAGWHRRPMRISSSRPTPCGRPPARISPTCCTKPAQKLTLEILDADGKTIRTFEGAEPAAGHGGTRRDDGRRRAGRSGRRTPTRPAAARRRPPAPSLKAGLNTLHVGSALPAGHARFRAWCCGARRRTVRWRCPASIRCGSPSTARRMTQPLVVKRHPLLHGDRRGSEGAVRRWRAQIRDKVNEANDAVIQIRRIKKRRGGSHGQVERRRPEGGRQPARTRT